MKVIAGLGNPGTEYEDTPHNVGFDVVALLAERLAVDWRRSTRFQARLARVDRGGDAWLLVQPQTFMNLSGTCVAPLVRYYGGVPADLVVVMDDADLPLGRIRIRPDGGSGGHRGLASVIESLGTGAFARVRMGVGRAGAADAGLVDHVLGRFDPARRQEARRMVAATAEAVTCLVERGVAEAMNRYNGPQVESADPAAAS
ncbi:MAG: aminoacyl-tRNA hydrolase [bacterium]